VDVRYEVICDEDFGDAAEPKNCTQNAKPDSQTEVSPVSEDVPTPDPTVGDSIDPSSDSTPDNPPTEPTIAPVDDGAFTCPGIGVFADPKDCRGYYRCDTISDPKHSTCIILTKFDPEKSGCSFGLC
jgi:hypothetical protein